METGIAQKLRGVIERSIDNTLLVEEHGYGGEN
jgi:hypothetical protein